MLLTSARPQTGAVALEFCPWRKGEKERVREGGREGDERERGGRVMVGGWQSSLWLRQSPQRGTQARTQLSLALSVLQGVGRRHAAMDPAGVQHPQHQDGCGAPPGAAGLEAAAAAGQGNGHLPSPQGALFAVLW